MCFFIVSRFSSLLMRLIYDHAIYPHKRKQQQKIEFFMLCPANTVVITGCKITSHHLCVYGWTMQLTFIVQSRVYWIQCGRKNQQTITFDFNHRSTNEEEKEEQRKWEYEWIESSCSDNEIKCGKPEQITVGLETTISVYLSVRVCVYDLAKSN